MEGGHRRRALTLVLHWLKANCEPRVVLANFLYCRIREKVSYNSSIVLKAARPHILGGRALSFEIDSRTVLARTIVLPGWSLSLVQALGGCAKCFFGRGDYLEERWKIDLRLQNGDCLRSHLVSIPVQVVAPPGLLSSMAMKLSLIPNQHDGTTTWPETH